MDKEKSMTGAFVSAGGIIVAITSALVGFVMYAAPDIADKATVYFVVLTGLTAQFGYTWYIFNKFYADGRISIGIEQDAATMAKLLGPGNGSPMGK